MFVEFFDHVEQHHGLDVVDEIIDRTRARISNEGAYTSVGNYPHAELLALATALSQVCGDDLGSILDKFAVHIMAAFKRIHPEYFEVKSTFDFLRSVGESIHIDVRKLYPDANPPIITTRTQADGSLHMSYQSHRPLARLAVALTKLTPSMYGENIDVKILNINPSGNAAEMLLRPIQ